MCVNSFMKNRQIWSNDIVLVPYRHMHVIKYNNWMKSSELQYLTGSEPLSLEEEYDMLNDWSNDCHKCTFIVLDRSTFETTRDEVESMIGDVNLFFDPQSRCKSAEIEVMIAEESHRGTGKGRHALLLMMRFAVEIIGVQQFIAKIKFDNLISQHMFSKFGFKEISRSDVFKEITYSVTVTREWIDGVKNCETNFRYQLL